MPIRVLLSDDETLARERLRSLLEEEADLEIVAECGDGKYVPSPSSSRRSQTWSSSTSRCPRSMASAWLRPCKESRAAHHLRYRL